MKTLTFILVVDDDKEDHLILQDYFSEIGLNDYLTYKENGKEALDFLESLPEQNLPDLIVLDLNMPILNGVQTLLQLKRSPRYKNIPVIIYSTSENENEKRKCLSYGALNYVVKPSTYDGGLAIVKYFGSFLGSTQLAP